MLATVTPTQPGVMDLKGLILLLVLVVAFTQEGLIMIMIYNGKK